MSDKRVESNLQMIQAAAGIAIKSSLLKALSISFSLNLNRERLKIKS